MKEPEELIRDGISAFNRGKFYDAHEHLEDAWSEYRLPDAKLIQGLIQLAVGYFHITNLNINGARGLFKKCIPKLEMFEDNRRGINVKDVTDVAKRAYENVMMIEDVKDFDWSIVPNIEYGGKVV